MAKNNVFEGYHEIRVEDLSKFDKDDIKQLAIKDFTDSIRATQLECTVQGFLKFLRQKGYKVIKDGSDD